MMKRWIAIVMACVFLLSGCGKKDEIQPGKPTKQPTVSQPAADSSQPTGPAADSAQLAALRAEINDSGALMGVAYLGYAELPFFEDVTVYLEANGFGDKYPFLYEIPEERIVRQEGCEIYAVVPASADVKLTVWEYGMDDGASFPEPGEELLQSGDGQPILLMGNISDIVPNLLVRAEEKDGLSADYAPCLSLEDFFLNPGEGVYDFTPTEMLGQYGPQGPVVTASALYGTWHARQYDESDELWAMTLTLERDGRAVYYYGYPYSDILERFEGTWSMEENQQLVLDLYGGPQSWDGSETSGEQYQMSSRFHYDFHGSALVLMHEDGNPLLYDTEGYLYEFLPFDGFYMMGDWVAESEYWGWTYELRLLDNGECWLSIYDDFDEQLVDYEGWWSVNDDVLDLSMSLSYGQHPESPELDYIAGSYGVSMSGPDDLTLEYGSGTILTVNMEGYGFENFVRYPDTYSGDPVSVHYSQDMSEDLSDCEWVIVDDTVPVDAVFCTMVPVEDFKVVSLFMQEDMSFDVTELYDYGTLDPDRPLIVTLTIYGTIPSYGISFADPSGVYRLYGVTLSGLDGSLELTEIN